MAKTHGWVRSPVLGGVLGAFAGGLTVLLLESAGHLLVGTGDPTAPGTITFPMFLSVLVAWIAGCWIGAAVATYWSRGRSLVPGIVVGLLLVGGAASNMIAFPHPVWMMVAAFVLMPLATFLGARAFVDGPGTAP